MKDLKSFKLRTGLLASRLERSDRTLRTGLLAILLGTRFARNGALRSFSKFPQWLHPSTEAPFAPEPSARINVLTPGEGKGAEKGREGRGWAPQERHHGRCGRDSRLAIHRSTDPEITLESWMSGLDQGGPLEWMSVFKSTLGGCFSNAESDRYEEGSFTDRTDR